MIRTVFGHRPRARKAQRAVSAHSRFHADRAVGRHRDHRRLDRSFVAGGAGRPRGGPAGTVLNNMMQLGIALQNYESSHEVLPPGVVNLTGPILDQPKGYHFGWMVQILPVLRAEKHL